MERSLGIIFFKVATERNKKISINYILFSLLKKKKTTLIQVLF